VSARYRPTLRGTEFRLLLLPALIACTGMLMIVLVPTGRVQWAWSDIWVSLAFAGIVLGMSVSFSVIGFRGDQVILPITATIAVIGLLMMQRLQPDLTAIDPGWAQTAQRQFIYLVAGLFAAWLVVVFAGPLGVVSWLRKYRNTWLLVSLALQAATFVIGTGPAGSGAKLWIAAGPIQIQPSEIVKITLVIYLASYLDDYRDLIGFSWRVGNIELPPIPYLVPMGLMWLASLLTLVVLNDLGSALLFFAVFLSMLYFASGRPVYVAVGTVAFLVACGAAYLAFDRVGIRVQNWLDPWQDPFVTGYQPIQSEYALASGGVLGTGFAQGSPWHIPAVETDYIFSAIGEELGLLGTLAVLTLYFLLVVRGYTTAIRARDGFVQLLAAGLTSIIAFQVIIIVGGVIRLIPLTGITLPFVSYGGSSLLSNLALIGLLLHLSSQPVRGTRGAS
jgi:cell division protein FtsW (lipid II flippase)